MSTIDFINKCNPARMALRNYGMLKRIQFTHIMIVNAISDIEAECYTLLLNSMCSCGLCDVLKANRMCLCIVCSNCEPSYSLHPSSSCSLLMQTFQNGNSQQPLSPNNTKYMHKLLRMSLKLCSQSFVWLKQRL